MHYFNKIGFGGSCHWCTEAIFQSLKGVDLVEQGWIASDGENTALSEAVVVAFNPKIISLQTLIGVHLHTHSCTSNHARRSKYRSAIYTFKAAQVKEAHEAVTKLQHEFNKPIITQVITYKNFRLNQQNFLNYYYSNPEKPFCKNVINPKLNLLLQRFSKNVDVQKISGMHSTLITKIFCTKEDVIIGC